MILEMVRFLSLYIYMELQGIIFCELINEVVLNNRKPDFLTQVKNNNLTYQDSLYNINMALNEIRSINNPAIHSEVKNLKAHELISVRKCSKS